jgi:hypothetical protein
MMDKNSSQGKPCSKCNKEALPNTDPPVCEDHLLNKQASEDGAEAGTLKELDAKD